MSFLKRQKEQKRAEKANAKRAARQARREQKAAGNAEEAPVEGIDPGADLQPG